MTAVMPRLETERLRLRRMEAADAPLIYDYMTDPEIAANTASIPYPYPAGGAEHFIAMCQEALENEEGYHFAIARRSDDLFLGIISLAGDHLHTEHSRAEIGYWLGKPHRLQGYTSEAARRLLRFGFEVVGLHRIYARFYTFNPASRRVMEKSGMTYEGTLRGHMFKDGRFIDVGYCGALNGEWR